MKTKYFDPLVNMPYDTLEDDCVILYVSNTITYVSDSQTILNWLNDINNDHSKIRHLALKRKADSNHGYFKLDYYVNVPIYRLVKKPNQTVKFVKLVSVRLDYIVDIVHDKNDTSIQDKLKIHALYDSISNKVFDFAGHLTICPRCNEATVPPVDNDSRKRTRKNKIKDTDGHTNCPECFATYCCLCNASPHHDGITCKEHTNIISTQQNLKILGYAQCPSCKQFVEKSGGCDHMKCETVGKFVGCGTHFCYTCNEQLYRNNASSHLQADYYDNPHGTLRCKNNIRQPYPSNPPTF